MNDNMRKCVAALRSGEFEQGRGQLRRYNSYCCLGVMCEVYRRETGRGEWIDGWTFEMEDRMANASLPFPVREWVGLRGGSGEYGSKTSLTDRNDAGVSFAEIADLIESEPAGLLVPEGDGDE